MNNHESAQIKTDFLNWVTENSAQLPLNSFCWDVKVFLQSADARSTAAPIELGKYNAKLKRGNPFYKPYSKIINFQQYE